jgi:hypothetical protein
MTATQTTPTPSPVINFATATGGKKPRLYDRIAAHPDAVLIENCIKYVAEISSAREPIFVVDPTGDNDFAGAFTTKARNRADRALTLITAGEPQTMDGLRAKAAIMDPMLAVCDGLLEAIDHDFLASLARDVIRLHRASQVTGQSAANAAVSA